jgi:hypothetical protein
MTAHSPQKYRGVAEAGWRWVLGQVREDDGPWIPESVTTTEAPEILAVPDYRDGMHSGVGGLAHVLAEIRLARPWTTDEKSLADAIADRVRGGIGDQSDCTYFDGLVSALGVLGALEVPGTETALARLAALATPDGWPQAAPGPPRFLPGARINDITLGTAGVLLSALWLQRSGVAGARQVAEQAAGVVMTEAEPLPTGTNWSFVPWRFWVDPYPAMPNLSHGLAGIAATLALAGSGLDRPDLTAAARSGAEHLVTLGDSSGRVSSSLAASLAEIPARTRSPTPGATAPPVPRCSSSPWTGQPPETSRATRRCRGTADACTASAPQACPPASTWLLGQRRPLLRNGRSGRGVPGLLAPGRRRP